MRVVLDSNIAIAAINHVPAVVDRLANIQAGDVGILIACSALEADAVLVSADRALLEGTIPGLRSENWLEQP